MANTWTWSSTLSTDMNLSTNYTQTGSGAFATGDLVYPNTGGLVAAIATGSLSCNSWNVNSGVTYQISLATYVLTINGSTASGIAGGSVTSSLGAGVTLAGNSLAFTVASGLTVATTNCFIVSGGIGNTWTDSRSTTTQYLGLNVTAGSLTTSAPNSQYFDFNGPTTPITIGTNATLTTNSSGYTRSLVTATGSSFYSMGAGAVWKGQSRIYLYAYANGITVTMPTLNYTGTASLFCALPYNNNTTIQVTGNINLGSTSGEFYNYGATGTVFDLNGHSLTCGAFASGSDTVGGSIALYYRNSTINCTSFNGSAFNVGTCNEYFGACTINCSGAVTIGSTHTVMSGNETWNITGTSTITTNRKMLGTINFKPGTLTITLGGNVYCKYYWILGTISRASYSIYGAYLIYANDSKSRQVVYQTMPTLPSKHPIWKL